MYCYLRAVISSDTFSGTLSFLTLLELMLSYTLTFKIQHNYNFIWVDYLKITNTKRFYCPSLGST